MITVKDLSLSFGERVLFSGINWTIGDKDRVGLVGGNGAGKTTLLRVIAGIAEPDAGSVELAGAASEIGYLPQDLAEIGHGTVLEFLRDGAGIAETERELAASDREVADAAPGSRELARALARHGEIAARFERAGGYEFDSTAKKILRGLGFAPGDEERMCGEFSGGWRMRIALAAVLIRRPPVLLLDEPTNHLDSESMEWLEGWLTAHTGALIFVSHDRRFLGRMAGEIAELSRGSLTRWSMGYERYLVEREAARERREREAADQREEIDRMQRFVDRFRYKASKAAQVQSRLKRLEKIELIETESSAPAVSFRFPEAPRSGRAAITASGIAKSYNGHEVYSGIDLEIESGERAAIVGVNGAGKSTLLRALACVEPPDAGEVKTGHGIRLAYYSQESAQNLSYDNTVWDEAKRGGGLMTEAAKRDLLGAFLFSGDDIHKPVRVLSGGEKSRLALFKLLLSESNLLILDEPTNHLDARTRDIFQDALLRYGGTLVIVSHDRYFLDRLATRVLEVRGGRLYNYAGSYSYFIEKREETLAREAEGAKKPAKIEQEPQRANDKRAEAERRNRVYRARKKYLDEIAATEREIETAEARVAEIDAELCASPPPSGDTVSALMKERSAASAHLEELYEKWERLSTEMEAAAAEVQ